MALTYVESGVLSVAGSVKSSNVATGVSSGPVVNWSNTVSLSNSNLDGVYVGNFTFTPTGTTPANIAYYTSTPLAAFTAAVGSVQSDGFPFSGFTAPGATTRVVGYHCELLTNSTWVSGAGSHTECTLKDESGNVVGVMGVPGDSVMFIGQTSKSAITAANYNTLTSTGAATYTFKIVYLYRNSGVCI